MSAHGDILDGIIHKYSGDEQGRRVIRCVASDLRRDLMRLLDDMHRSVEMAEQQTEAWKRFIANQQPRTLLQRWFS